MKKENIIISVTCGLFFIEAIIHYNIGLRSKRIGKGITFPDNKEFLQIIITVFIFSILSGLISSQLIS